MRVSNLADVTRILSKKPSIRDGERTLEYNTHPFIQKACVRRNDDELEGRWQGGGRRRRDEIGDDDDGHLIEWKLEIELLVKIFVVERQNLL